MLESIFSGFTNLALEMKVGETWESDAPVSNNIHAGTELIRNETTRISDDLLNNKFAED